jgi:hypothetical protein
VRMQRKGFRTGWKCSKIRTGFHCGRVAQLGEHLLCKHAFISSKSLDRRPFSAKTLCLIGLQIGLQSFPTESAIVLASLTGFRTTKKPPQIHNLHNLDNLRGSDAKIWYGNFTMSTELQRLSFDTSGVNALADSPDCAALLAGIRSGYFACLTFPSVAEPLATSDPHRRNTLFDILNFLRVKGECLEAPHWIVTQLVQDYERSGRSDWELLNLRFEGCEVAIARRDFSENESKEERDFCAATEAKFTGLYSDTRPVFEKVFADGTERPTNADELLTHLCVDGGAHWKLAAGLYKRAVGVLPSEEQIRVFVERCPPFKAMMLGLNHAQFEWAIREKPIKKNKRVGRIDLFCSIYLPYCDLYVTNDDEQRRCLTEIAAATKLPVEVLSFAEFSNRLMPLAYLSRGA